MNKKSDQRPQVGNDDALELYVRSCLVAQHFFGRTHAVTISAWESYKEASRGARGILPIPQEGIETSDVSVRRHFPHLLLFRAAQSKLIGVSLHPSDPNQRTVPLKQSPEAFPAMRLEELQIGL